MNLTYVTNIPQLCPVKKVLRAVFTTAFQRCVLPGSTVRIAQCHLVCDCVFTTPVVNHIVSTKVRHLSPWQTFFRCVFEHKALENTCEYFAFLGTRNLQQIAGLWQQVIKVLEAWLLGKWDKGNAPCFSGTVISRM